MRQPRSRAPAPPRCQPGGLPLPLTASPSPVRRARCEAPLLTSSQGYPSIVLGELTLAHWALGGRAVTLPCCVRARAHRVPELSRGGVYGRCCACAAERNRVSEYFSVLYGVLCAPRLTLSLTQTPGPALFDQTHGRLEGPELGAAALLALAQEFTLGD